jgi:hypothetical protein
MLVVVGMGGGNVDDINVGIGNKLFVGAVCFCGRGGIEVI